MGRAWRAGDVAMVTVEDREVFCTFYDTGRERGWFHGLGFTDHHYVACEGEADARPLVVIDPEDRDQVARLRDAVWPHKAVNLLQNWQAALRDFADPIPPKPEEPTGLGAVVVDACGDTWVRVSLRDTEPWQHRGERRQYKVINAAKVLSEGVTS